MFVRISEGSTLSLFKKTNNKWSSVLKAKNGRFIKIPSDITFDIENNTDLSWLITIPFLTLSQIQNASKLSH